MENLKAPKGTRDIFYPEVKKWQFFEEKIREYFSKALFREIRTPVFERSELFIRGIGDATEVVKKEMYTFEDKAKRSMTLRPENTASVVRALIENNLINDYFPLRFFYIGPMFRYDKPQKGRYRQFHQFGIEIYGDETPFADAEVIFSSYDFLQSIGIKDMEMQINSVGCKECRPEYISKLKQSAEKSRDYLCADCRRKIDTNPLRIFDCKVEGCKKVSEGLPKITDNLCEVCSSHYNDVKKNLEFIGTPFVENKKLVRGLDYYTKTTFEIVTEGLGTQNAILGGGRYNDLVKELGGPNMSGIGFSGGIERILLLLDTIPPENGKTVLVAFHSEGQKREAFGLTNFLRSKGISTYMDYSSNNLKKQFKKGDKISADFAFILGEDEIKSGSVSIKNMREKRQIIIKREEMEEWLKKNC